jgi:hypothetical protein
MITFKKNCIFICIILAYTHIYPYTYELSICAIFRNEARFLREWIEFHKLIGVQHFFLYNHLSTDNFKAVLEPYIARQEVDLVNWTNEAPNYQWQMSAYQDALAKTRGITKWLAVIDLDEYIVPIEQDNLIDFLKPFEQYGGVCINWLMFGTSNINKIRDNELMIEQLVMCQGKPNQHVKSIVQPDKVIQMSTQHHALYKAGYYQVTPEHKKCNGPFNLGGKLDKIRINHYWTQDAYYCYTIKIPRFVDCHINGNNYLKKLELMKFVLDENNSFNKQQDTTIFKYIDKLKRTMNINAHH